MYICISMVYILIIEKEKDSSYIECSYRWFCHFKTYLRHVPVGMCRFLYQFYSPFYARSIIYLLNFALTLGLLHCFKLFPALYIAAGDIMGILSAHILGDYICKRGITGKIMKYVINILPKMWHLFLIHGYF